MEYGETWLNAQSQVIYQSTLGYDNAGNLVLAQDNNSEYNYTYNAAGQMTGEAVTYPGYSKIVASLCYSSVDSVASARGATRQLPFCKGG